jgi:hypothetical protein
VTCFRVAAELPYRAFTHLECITTPYRLYGPETDMEATGMVYSSRLDRAPRGRTFEVTAARLICDAHRMRGAIRRVATDV